MPDVQRLVRQWLETDAAFGVVDVPLVRGGERNAVPAATQASVAPQPAEPRPFAVRREMPLASPTVPPRPPVAAVTSSSVGSENSMPPRKVAVMMPPAPAGDIAALPPITRRQKEVALERLFKETEAASAQFINEIATKLVFGEGDPDARILFIGEGPGVEEDKTGRPFVGRSGQLLDKMIGAMGFKRGEATGGVYIANVVKLRAAEMDEATGRLKDRPPTPEEAARGMPVLHQQIEIIRPHAIVTLGAPAIKYLTGTTEGVMKIRGTWMAYRGIPVMPTYHPSFLLRAYTEENRRKVWSDLQAAMGKVGK